MTREEIRDLSLAMTAFFSGGEQQFLITNASMELLVAEFAARLLKARDQEKFLKGMGGAAAFVAKRAVEDAVDRKAIADFDGAHFPVLTEHSAELVAKLCPENFEKF